MRLQVRESHLRRQNLPVLSENLPIAFHQEAWDKLPHNAQVEFVLMGCSSVSCFPYEMVPVPEFLGQNAFVTDQIVLQMLTYLVGFVRYDDSVPS